MVEGQKRRVESIKQQVQDIALNVRDRRFKEKISGKARTQRRRSRTCHDAPVGAGLVGAGGYGRKKIFKK